MLDRSGQTAGAGALTEREQTVRRFLPNEIGSLDCMESWFSDMAEQGLFLKEVGEVFATFRRGEPARRRYRMDVRHQALTEDELGLYDACGWHWVYTKVEMHCFAADTLFYVFQTDEDATVPELHTDPMEQAESLRYLARLNIVDLSSMVACTLLIVVLGFWQQLSRGKLWLLLVYGEYVGSWYQMPVLLFWDVVSFSRWRNVRRLRKRLAMGEAMDHRAKYRRHFHYGVMRLAMPALIVLLLFGNLLLMQSGQEDVEIPTLPLPQTALDFPAVRLAQVETETLEPLSEADSWLKEETTATGAVIYRTRESGVSACGAMELNTACYQLPYAWESRYVLAGILAQEQQYRVIGSPQPVETDLVDEAWVAHRIADQTTDDCRKLYVRDGRYVLVLSYDGDREMTELLPLLAEQLEQSNG